MTRVAIVIVSFNARDDLAAHAREPTRSAAATSHRDCRSRQRLDRWRARTRARALPRRASASRLGGNLGFARANNLGIRATASELVLLLNPDTIVPAGAIDAMVARIDLGVRRQRYRAAPGRPRGARGVVLRHDVQPLVRGATQDRAVARCAGLWADAPLDCGATRRERAVDWVSGACLLVRRDRRGSGRLARRALLHVRRRRRFLCGPAQGGRPGAVLARRRDCPLRGGSRRTNPGPARDAWRRQPPGVLPQALAALGRPVGVVLEALTLPTLPPPKRPIGRSWPLVPSA